MANQHFNARDRSQKASAWFAGLSSSPYNDLVILLALAGVTLLSLYLPDAGFPIVRLPLALALFMFLPGYAFVAALFPRKGDLSLIARLSLSGGMSLVISPLIGFALNYTAWGVARLPMAAGVVSITVAFAGAAAVRRRLAPAGERFGIDLVALARAAWNELSPTGRQGREKTATIMLLASLALAIATAAIGAAVPVQHERYTELYLYGNNGTIADYPHSFVLGEAWPVTVGIANHEGNAMAYNLVVTIDGLGAGRQQIYSERIALADGGTLEKAIDLTPVRAGTRLNVMFLLYVDGAPDTPYRSCNLWVDVVERPMHEA